MTEPASEPAAAGQASPPVVLLLCLWFERGQAWHASLVAPDAAKHDFDSPFELARYLAQAPRQTPPANTPSLK